MVSLRRRDRVADDVYYYGVFAPQSNFESFCRRGCVTGLSGLVDNAGDSFLRASVGLYNLSDRRYWYWQDVRELDAGRADLQRFAQPGLNTRLTLTLRF